MANNWGADLFISNHVNAGGGAGVEVWASAGNNTGKAYAASIATNIERNTPLASRGVKTSTLSDGRDYLHVIRETTMTAILIEHGFIDNKKDLDILTSESMQKNLALLTVDALVNNSSGSSSSDLIDILGFKRSMYLTNPIMIGNDIVLIQKMLKSLNHYSGAIDGYFNTETKSAISSYQSKSGLNADGSCGPNTLKSLFSTENQVKSCGNRAMFEGCEFEFPRMEGSITIPTGNPHIALTLGLSARSYAGSGDVKFTFGDKISTEALNELSSLGVSMDVRTSDITTAFSNLGWSVNVEDTSLKIEVLLEPSTITGGKVRLTLEQKLTISPDTYLYVSLAITLTELGLPSAHYEFDFYPSTQNSLNGYQAAALTLLVVVSVALLPQISISSIISAVGTFLSSTAIFLKSLLDTFLPA